MRFGILGALAVWADGELIEIPERKVRALLANLILHDGRVVSTSQLIEDLWGDDLPADPAATLRSKVSQLRRALETAEAGGRSLVVHEEPGYRLRIDAHQLDVADFTALVGRARATPDHRARVELLTEALDLWRGEPLADVADQTFAQASAARWQEQRLTALEERAEAQLELGEHGAVTSELAELIAAHPLRERPRAAQMRALYRAGRQHDALACFRDLRMRLVDELGVEPSPELAALQLAILEHDPSLGGPSPAPERVERRSNLPSPPTALIGRDDAVRELRTLIETTRLVTLTGPGGVGKTRLATKVASEMPDAFPGGVWLVELAGLRDEHHEEPGTADDVTYAIATALGLRDDAPAPTTVGSGRGTRPPDNYDRVDHLTNALAQRRCLLVLDNCEHLTGPAAIVTERLLRDTAGVHILATSREPLRLSGEVLRAVPPLGVPDDRVTANPLEVLRSPAVELFVARAAAAAPGFALDSETAPWIVNICQRLDGIPLALELAATRVRAIGVRELTERLDDRFQLLVRGNRDADTRHQTLAAVIDWSWSRLTTGEQTVLSRLAASADGYDLDAAEVLCAAGGVTSAEVLDILNDLIDRSLVMPSDTIRPRYRLLESIGAYCRDRLVEAGELVDAQQRHARYFTELVERADAGLRGPQHHRWSSWIDDESRNLREAFDLALQRADAASALRLATALSWYWYVRGRMSDGHRHLSAALEVPDDGAAPRRAEATALRAGFARWVNADAGPTRAAVDALARLDELGTPTGQAKALWLLALPDVGRSDVPDVDIHLDLALKRFTYVDDPWAIALSLTLRAHRRFVLGPPDDDATRGGERAVVLFRDLGDRWGELQAAQALADLADSRRDWERAKAMASDALVIAAELDLPSDLSYALSRLGRLALRDGDHAGADEYHERARQLAADQGNWIAQEYAEIGLALCARQTARLDEAEVRLTGWADRLHHHGERADTADRPWSQAFRMAELGFIAELRGDGPLALARHIDGGTAALASHEPRAIALALEGTAGALSLLDRTDEAARCLGAATALREAVDASVPETERQDVDRITRRLRDAMGDDALRRALYDAAACDATELLASFGPARA